MTAVKKQTKLVDLAKAAGVAKSTASMALSGHWSINADTRERVRRIADELGYEANPYAQRLGGQRSRTVALLSNGIDRSTGREKLLAIQERITAIGYDVPIYAGGDASSHDPARQVKLIAELRRLMPLAIIFHNAQIAPESLAELKLYQEQGGTLVAYGGEPFGECDNVLIDANENMYRAAKYLLEQGHRNIGLCEHFEKPFGPTGRLDGFRRALAEFGAEYREEWWFWGGLFERNGAMLAERFLALDERPTGLCIVNDYSASSFVNCLSRAGFSVPRDVSIVAHDDGMAAEYCLVPLTTVTHPIAETAVAVERYLCSRLDASYDGPARMSPVYGELVVRESVRRV
ncbi:MAG TPA: LacI family DNA-binding transcriptional regulator [Capsulimonadaceae bacterium]|jgi:DNA-binding LacI/PurR family transcriptional regulator